MSKKVQIATQLHFPCKQSNAHKPWKLGFNSTWTKNFWKYKLNLEKAESRDQIANICWIIEEAREFQINIYFCFMDYAKYFGCVDHSKLWKLLKERNTRPPYLPPEKSVCRSRSNSLNRNVEQWTGSKSGKEYVKAVYCHPAYLTYMQSTSCKIPGWMKHKLESRLLEWVGEWSCSVVSDSLRPRGL